MDTLWQGDGAIFRVDSVQLGLGVYVLVREAHIYWFWMRLQLPIGFGKRAREQLISLIRKIPCKATSRPVMITHQPYACPPDSRSDFTVKTTNLAIRHATRPYARRERLFSSNQSNPYKQINKPWRTKILTTTKAALWADLKKGEDGSPRDCEKIQVQLSELCYRNHWGG